MFSHFFLTGEKYTHLFNTSLMWHGSHHKDLSSKEMVKILAFILGWQREAIVEKWLNYMSLTFFFFFLTQLNRAVNQSSTGLGRRKAHSWWILWASLCQRLKQGIFISCHFSLCYCGNKWHIHYGNSIPYVHNVSLPSLEKGHCRKPINIISLLASTAVF